MVRRYKYTITYLAILLAAVILYAITGRTAWLLIDVVGIATLVRVGLQRRDKEP